MDRPDRSTLEGIEPSLLEREDFDLEQRGLRALPHEHGVLVRQEYWVARFQQWVLERLDGAS